MVGQETRPGQEGKCAMPDTPPGHVPAPPRPPYARTVELHGHIIDSHILSQVMDLVMDRGDGNSGPALVAEARDAAGTRLFWMQPYRVDGGRVAWEDPVGHGWRDPGEEEMILDAAFRVRRAEPQTRKKKAG